MSDNPAQLLADRVRQLRANAGLTLRALASTADVNYSWLSKLENGQYESPDPRLLYRLAVALDVEVNEFYLAAGYAASNGLPGMDMYLRSKYDLPDEAVAQLVAHFELINEKYRTKPGEAHVPSHRPTT